MPRKPIATPPTIEQVTTAREAQTAVNLAATAANRAGRHELRKQAPDWPLQRANFPKDKR